MMRQWRFGSGWSAKDAHREVRKRSRRRVALRRRATSASAPEQSNHVRKPDSSPPTKHRRPRRMPCPNPTVSRCSGTVKPEVRCVFCFLPHTCGHSPPRKVHKSRVLRLGASRSPLYMYFLPKSLAIQRAFRERDASVATASGALIHDSNGRALSDAK